MQVLKPEIRNEILSVSRDLFFEQGYQGTTMRMVSERLKMSVSNLYNYFRNKEDLFEEVVGEYALKFQNGYKKVISHNESDEFSKERISIMINGFTVAINENPRIFFILMDRSQGSAYQSFKQDCVSILEKHMLTNIPESQKLKLIVQIVVFNLFNAFATIARKYGGTPQVKEQLEILFKYHMAGYQAIK